MLPKKYRLPLRKELHRLQKEGKVFQFPFFGLLVGQNKGEVSRFGFIVSKKINKKATRRHRIKRHLREAVRILLPKAKPGFEAVFLVKKRILGKDFPTVQAAVKQSFQKVGLL